MLLLLLLHVMLVLLCSTNILKVFGVCTAQNSYKHTQ